MSECQISLDQCGISFPVCSKNDDMLKRPKQDLTKPGPDARSAMAQKVMPLRQKSWVGVW